MHYQLLKDELTQLIQDFSENPYTSEWQKKTYAIQRGKKKSFTHEQFARELPNTSTKPLLKLSRKDGYANQLVGSLSHKAARSFWYYENDGHTFVPLADMVRICFFFHCDLFETLRLCLKNEWEKHLAKKRGYKLNMGAPFSEFVPGDDLTEDDFAEFNPSIEDLVNQIQTLVDQLKHHPGSLPEQERLEAQFYYCDSVVWSSIAKEMIVNQVMLQSSNDPSLEAFVASKQDEINVSGSDQKKLQHLFWERKCTWIELQEESIQLLYDTSKLNLSLAYVKKNYLQQFGKEYIRLQEVIYDMAILKRKIMQKENAPELTENEIVELLHKQEEEAEKELDDLRYWAGAPETHKANGESVNSKFEDQYELEIRQLLRELQKLLHPEMLVQHENYKKLTEKQLNQLRDLWDELMRVKASECVYAEGTVGHDNPSLIKLKIIKMKAKNILEALGLPGEVTYSIQGKTLEERITWLNEHIELYKNKNHETKNKMFELAQNQRIKEMKAVMQTPATHEAYRQKMQDEIERLELEKAEFQSRWETLWEGGASHAD